MLSPISYHDVLYKRLEFIVKLDSIATSTPNYLHISQQQQIPLNIGYKMVNLGYTFAILKPIFCDFSYRFEFIKKIIPDLLCMF